jgi:hypothetical protein
MLEHNLCDGAAIPETAYSRHLPRDHRYASFGTRSLSSYMVILFAHGQARKPLSRGSAVRRVTVFLAACLQLPSSIPLRFARQFAAMSKML